MVPLVETGLDFGARLAWVREGGDGEVGAGEGGLSGGLSFGEADNSVLSPLVGLSLTMRCPPRRVMAWGRDSSGVASTCSLRV